MTDQSPSTPAKKPLRHLESETADETCSPEEIEAVRSCMAAFATATKNYSLYPKEHAISENLLSSFENSLADFFQISATLKKMIIADEKRNRTEDVLDVLLILLEDQNETEAFEDILEILTHEFETILQHGEFRLALKMFNHLKKLSNPKTAPKPWQSSPVGRFFENVSNPELLSGLSRHVPKFKAEDIAPLKALQQVLTMMHPKAVLILGPLLSKVSSQTVRRRLMEAIAILSKQDLGPLRELLKSPDEILIQQLVIILGHLHNKQSFKQLLKMARHPSLRVRRESLKQLLKRSGKVQQSFFFLLEDPSDSIRLEILNRLAAERHSMSEILLLKYLSENAYNILDRDHILNCYKALGKCGSSRSVPFLGATLQERPWVDIFRLGQPVHRWGAAMALAELGLPEANEILQHASWSFFPQIKRAARGVSLTDERHE
jgi:hypothetical protein